MGGILGTCSLNYKEFTRHKSLRLYGLTFYEKFNFYDNLIGTIQKRKKKLFK